MEKEDFINRLIGLRNHLQDRTARPEDILDALRTAVEDFGLRDENPELWENYKTSDELEDMLKDAIDGGINRLYYFINDVDLRDVSVMYVDNYGNCDSKIGYEDLINVIDGIINGLES